MFQKSLKHHLGEVQRYADNVQCATCIKRNITIIMKPFAPFAPFYLVSSFGYSPFETLLWAITRSFSNTPRIQNDLEEDFFLGIFFEFDDNDYGKDAGALFYAEIREIANCF